MASRQSQKPLELILARNLLSSLSTAAFLVDDGGMIAFYNEAAGGLLGRRFEETGPMPASEWIGTFGPFSPDGSPMAFEEIALTKHLMRGQAAHDRMRIRSADGAEHTIESSGLPIFGTGGYRGAIVVFWPVEEQERAA